MTADTSIRAEQVTPRRLWFGLAASAAAWVSLGCIDLIITWRACYHRAYYGMPSDHPAARTLFIVISCILLITAAVAGWISYRNWRALSERQWLHVLATDRREFMAFLGIFVSVTLGVGILMLSLPPLVLGLCGRAR